MNTYAARARRAGVGVPPERALPRGRGTGYEVLSYPLAGMAAYGAIGWLVGRAVHVAALLPVGLLVGIVLSLGLVIHRYGRTPPVRQNANDRGPGPRDGQSGPRGNPGFGRRVRRHPARGEGS